MEYPHHHGCGGWGLCRAEVGPSRAGFITLFFGIGQAIGPYVGGLFADMTGSFTLAFILASGVSVIGAVGSLALRSPRREA